MKKYLVLAAVFTFIIMSLLIYSNISKNEKEKEIITNKILRLEELVTAKQIYKEILYSKESQDILWIPVKNREFLISINYIVTAGIDISKGFNIEKKDDVYILTIPKGEIFSIDADDSSIYEYFVKERFSQLKRDDYFKLIIKSKEDILNGDKIPELLQNCEYNAGRLLTSLLQLSNISIEVRFSDSFKVKQ
ncbi:MAG: DUF4230 domain-containing protein [Spirochaetales bacterium]|nr:DUF4230 domain-containing protein [Spirochaetales bacterium]